MRSRLDGPVYDEVFQLVLGIVEAKGLLRGKVAGVDSTYLRADASMKSIVRKDTGSDYTTYLNKLCEAEGIDNPTVEDARRMDRARKGKKTSNKDWESPTDRDARIVRLKDGRTRLGYRYRRPLPPMARRELPVPRSASGCARRPGPSPPGHRR
jgi:transposase